jgi:hypothetical protein
VCKQHLFNERVERSEMPDLLHICCHLEQCIIRSSVLF